jgi:hypothetical protein
MTCLSDVLEVHWEYARTIYKMHTSVDMKA